MKKKLILTLLAPMMCLSLAGCHSNIGMKLTYGTYIVSEDDSICDAVKIDYSGLKARMDESGVYHNENFLLTIAPTNGCICWAKFQGVLKQFIKDTHYLVYQINCDEFGENNQYGLTFQEGHVTFAIVKNGVIVKQYTSGEVLESKEALKTEVNKFVKAPELYYVDEPFLNEAIKTGETTLVQYMKHSCGDCNYVDPNVLWPYVHKNTLKTKMYVIDIDGFEDEYEYQGFKDRYLLSKALSTEFGYDTGYVPTFQYYERGKIKSASVFFNDSVEKVADGYEVSNSYYTSERLANLDYAKNVTTNVLKGLTLQEDDVISFKGKYYWKQASATTYHTPLLEAFLKTYTK